MEIHAAEEVILHLLPLLLVLVHVNIKIGKAISIVMMITTIVDVVGMAVIVVEKMLTNLTARNANVLTQKPKHKCCRRFMIFLVLFFKECLMIK